ncbi:hypothetical protein PDE01_16590 [Paracoccus denitrificans]|nr:hypothetical protein PDE01_16590 [Paracoccus denitrificans]
MQDAVQLLRQRGQVGVLDRNPRQMRDLAGFVLGDRHERLLSLAPGFTGVTGAGQAPAQAELYARPPAWQDAAAQEQGAFR